MIEFFFAIFCIATLSMAMDWADNALKLYESKTDHCLSPGRQLNINYYRGAAIRSSIATFICFIATIALSLLL